MSPDIELWGHVEGEQLSLHRENRSTPNISAAVLLKRNNKSQELTVFFKVRV